MHARASCAWVAAAAAASALPGYRPGLCKQLSSLPLQPLLPVVLQTINELGRKARDGTLSIDEMAGGTFTIRCAPPPAA